MAIQTKRKELTATTDYQILAQKRTEAFAGNSSTKYLLWHVHCNADIDSDSIDSAVKLLGVPPPEHNYVFSVSPIGRELLETLGPNQPLSVDFKFGLVKGSFSRAFFVFTFSAIDHFCCLSVIQGQVPCHWF